MNQRVETEGQPLSGPASRYGTTLPASVNPQTTALPSPNLGPPPPPELNSLNTRLDKRGRETETDKELFRKPLSFKVKDVFEEKAVRYTHPTTKKKKKYPFCNSIEDFKIYGPGIFLFFDWLKHLIVLFFFLSICSGVAVYCNYHGNRFKAAEVSSKLDFTMLGNNAVTIDEIDKTVIDWKNIFGSKNSRALVLLSDYVYTLLLFLFVLYYNLRLPGKIRRIKRDFANVRNFAIEISNVPQELNIDNLKASLNKFGPIYSLNLTKTFLGSFEDYRKVSKIDTKARYIQALNEEYGVKESRNRKIQSLTETVKKKKQKIIKSFQSQGKDIHYLQDFPNSNIFAIFMNQSDRNAVLDEAQEIDRKNKIRKIFCCMKKPQPIFEFDGRPLKFRPSDQPSNINYENIGISWKRKLLNRLFLFLIIKVIIILSFLVMYAFKQLDFSFGSEECLITPSKEDIDRIVAENGGKYTLKLTFCYCRELGYKELLSGENKKYCQEFYKYATYSYLLIFMNSFVILVINAVLRLIISKLSNKMLFNRFSSEMTYTTYIIFLSEIFNYLLSTLLLRGSFLGFKPGYYLSEFLKLMDPSLAGNQVVYLDYTTDWYLDIASKIASEFMIEMFLPHGLMLFYQPLRKLFRKCYSKTAKLQYDVVNIYTPAACKFAPKIAHILSQIFICVLFSSGVPVLTLFTFAFLIIFYWITKWFFLRYAERPRNIDETTAIMTGKLSYFLVLIHCFMAIYIYKAQGIFNFPEDVNPLRLVKFEVKIPTLDPDTLANQLVFVILAGASLWMIFVNFVLTPLLGKVGVIALFSCRCNKKFKDIQEEEAKKAQKLEEKERKQDLITKSTGLMKAERINLPPAHAINTYPELVAYYQDSGMPVTYGLLSTDYYKNILMSFEVAPNSNKRQQEREENRARLEREKNQKKIGQNLLQQRNSMKTTNPDSVIRQGSLQSQAAPSTTAPRGSWFNKNNRVAPQN